MWAVMKFYHMLRSGISWKLNETIIELWHSSYDINKTSTTLSYCAEEGNDVKENENLHIDGNKNESYLMSSDSCCRKRIPQIIDNDDDCDSLSDNETSSDNEQQIGDGSEENDSFLVAYDAKTIASVWQ